ncbi:MAG: hypothetical protein COA94_04830 [Rickettsiales bacterium]|nr:MAG: hypothetical protein COA94_04830 [Rickettsiales bacterium]
MLNNNEVPYEECNKIFISSNSGDTIPSWYYTTDCQYRVYSRITKSKFMGGKIKWGMYHVR